MDGRFITEVEVEVEVPNKVPCVPNNKKVEDWSEPILPAHTFFNRPLLYTVKAVDLKYDVSTDDIVIRLLVTNRQSAERYCVKINDENIKKIFSDLHKTQDINIKIRDDINHIKKTYGVMAIKDNLKSFDKYNNIEDVYKFINFDTIMDAGIAPIMDKNLQKFSEHTINLMLNKLALYTDYNKLILPVIDDTIEEDVIKPVMSDKIDSEQRLNMLDFAKKVYTYLVFDASTDTYFYIDSYLLNKVLIK